MITLVFWVAMDAAGRATERWPAPDRSKSIVLALSSATAASFMYGWAVFIALKLRSAQIERRVWREKSPRCLISIAVRAGLVTWVVIIATTVVWGFEDTWKSLAGIAHVLKSLANGQPADGAAEWSFLPSRIMTALPWLLVGATASAVLASSLDGDVRRTNRSQRVADAIFVGGALGVAAGSAQLLQISFMEVFSAEARPRSDVDVLCDVLTVALAGFACGAVLGFKVPWACRSNLVTPPNPIRARILRNLLRHAESALGSKVAASNWVFMRNNDLGGITPAEAVQYQTLATGVGRLLEAEALRRREEARADRPVPVVIEGGRDVGRPAA